MSKTISSSEQLESFLAKLVRDSLSNAQAAIQEGAVVAEQEDKEEVEVKVKEKEKPAERAKLKKKAKKMLKSKLTLTPRKTRWKDFLLLREHLSALRQEQKSSFQTSCTISIRFAAEDPLEILM